MKVFCSIRDFGDQGWDALPAMSILFDEVVLWRPAFHTFSTELPGYSLGIKDYIQLFEEGLLGVGYDGNWDNEAFRQELVNMEAQRGGDQSTQMYYEPFDSKLSQFPISRKIDDSGRSSDVNWAREQLEKKTDALNEANRWSLEGENPYYLPLPTGTQKRAEVYIQEKEQKLGRELKAEEKQDAKNWQVLRDARMLQRLITELKAEMPVHRDHLETSLYNSVAPWKGHKIVPERAEYDDEEVLRSLFNALKPFSKLRGAEQIRSIKADKKVKDYLNVLIGDKVKNIANNLNYQLNEFKNSKSLLSVIKDEYFGDGVKSVKTATDIVKLSVKIPGLISKISFEDLCEITKKILLSDTQFMLNNPWLVSNILYHTNLRKVRMEQINRIVSMIYFGETKLKKEQVNELIKLAA